MPALTWVDFAIVGIIGLSGLVGMMRGLVKEVFALATLGCALWVALHYNGIVAKYFETSISVVSGRIAVAFVILLLGTLAAANLLSFMLQKLLQGAGLSGTDRIFGLLFGIVRGTVAVALVVFLAGLTPFPEEPWWKESKLIPPFQSLAYWLRNRVPPVLADYFKF